MDEWHLEIARWGTDEFTQLARGESTLSASLLTTLSPAALANGFYRLRLTARDMSGRTDTAETWLEVTGYNKNGFRYQETDATLSVAGKSVPIVRAYDSLDNGVTGSFGNGWRWTLGDFRIQTNLPVDRRESFGVFEPMRDGTRLYLTVPSGERVGFTFTPQQIETGSLVIYRPAWTADVGHDFVLESAQSTLRKADGKYYQLNTGLPYHPASPFIDGPAYTVVGADGSRYELDGVGRASTLTLAGGTQVLVDGSNITDSAGNILASFVRDSAGRITALAANSQVIHYEYDDAGNLRSVAHGNQDDSSLYDYHDDDRLSLAANGQQGATIAYDPTIVRLLDSNLGQIGNFSNRDIQAAAAADDRRYLIEISDADLATAPGGRLILATYLETAPGHTAPVAAAASAIRLGAVSQNSRSVGFFQIDRAGLYRIDVPAGAGEFTLRIQVAGDINRDGSVDGADGQTLVDSFGKAPDAAGIRRRRRSGH